MNKPTTLRDTLRTHFEVEAPPRDARKLLRAGLRLKHAAQTQPFASFNSLYLDLQLFVHKYFAAALFSALLIAGIGGWVAFSTFGSKSSDARHEHLAIVVSEPTLISVG